MEKVTKREFINMVSKKLEKKVSKKILENFIDVFFGTIKEVVVNGGEVYFKDFGGFSVYEVKEKYCINPVTKERIVIPPTKKLKFKQSAYIKMMLNNKQIDNINSDDI